ncbi:hypothetical protein TRFO_05934 [Tritrichomonas foetus]|uniref:NET domain-containing protein n=1 Tax=Tritrichomonas foetus TaxID=1144522 RepID=A0A1J4K7G9_9EUKA|nr:hypothetical protein TRFO_05934 [Tritrichomonas foetus]|eukprot:OHT05357.1 hypothetical protein TRFO_05934 [Tritrichomonas foetus]
MNKKTTEKILLILDDIFQHPMCTIFIRGSSSIGEEKSISHLRSRIISGDFRNENEAITEMYDIIRIFQECDDYLNLVGEEIKKLIQKKYEFYFAAPENWGIRVANLRAQLTELTVDAPQKVKALCQWPTKQSIKKPEIVMINPEDIKNMVNVMNELSEEKLQGITNIIQSNEPEINLEGNLNLAILKPTTLSQIQKYIYEPVY